MSYFELSCMGAEADCSPCPFIDRGAHLGSVIFALGVVIAIVARAPALRSRLVALFEVGFSAAGAFLLGCFGALYTSCAEFRRSGGIADCTDNPTSIACREATAEVGLGLLILAAAIVAFVALRRPKFPVRP